MLRNLLLNNDVQFRATIKIPPGEDNVSHAGTWMYGARNLFLQDLPLSMHVINVREKNLAAAMGYHGRLGSNSVLRMLCSDLIRSALGNMEASYIQSFHRLMVG